MGGTTTSYMVAAPLALGVLWSVVCAYVQRFHDLERSGWWTLILFVPFANLLGIFYLGFFDGTSTSNDFGPRPVPWWNPNRSPFD